MDLIWISPVYNYVELGKWSGLDGKESACNGGDLDLIPGLERSLGEGNGNPLQYFCLENSMDRGALQASSMGSQRVGHDWVTNTTLGKWGAACEVSLFSWREVWGVFRPHFGEGNGNPLQYFCLENSMDRGAGLQSMGSQGLTEQQTFTFTFRGRGNREHSAHNRKCLSTPFNTFKLSIYSTSHQFPWY